MTKICSVCKQELPIDAFYVRKDRPSGRVSQCKTCWSITHVVAKKKWRLSDVGRAYNRAWSKVFSKNHRDKRNAIHRQRRMKKLAALGSRSRMSVDQFAAWKAAQLVRQRNRCYWRFDVCTARWGFSQSSRPTEDHVVPLVAGGLDNIGNIVLACLNCNSSKSGRRLTLL